MHYAIDIILALVFFILGALFEQRYATRLAQELHSDLTKLGLQMPGDVAGVWKKVHGAEARLHASIGNVKTGVADEVIKVADAVEQEPRAVIAAVEKPFVVPVPRV